jgi:hypothetical protein
MQDGHHPHRTSPSFLISAPLRSLFTHRVAQRAIRVLSCTVSSTSASTFSSHTAQIYQERRSRHSACLSSCYRTAAHLPIRHLQRTFPAQESSLARSFSDGLVHSCVHLQPCQATRSTAATSYSFQVLWRQQSNSTPVYHGFETRRTPASRPCGSSFRTTQKPAMNSTIH